LLSAKSSELFLLALAGYFVDLILFSRMGRDCLPWVAFWLLSALLLCTGDRSDLCVELLFWERDLKYVFLDYSDSLFMMFLAEFIEF
jgi:hypothetical protein